MTQLYEPGLNVGLQLLELLALIALAALVSRRVPNLRTVALAIVILAVAHMALFVGLLVKTPLHWNWIGKLLSIGVTFAAIAMLPSIGWRDAGFTSNQHGGLKPAILAAAIVCLFAWGTNVLLSGGLHFTVPTFETLLYQATMPGFNEEPLYRGLALVLIDRAFGDVKIGMLGARIGWGACITSVWFGLIHGNGFEKGHFQFALAIVVIIAIVGFGLAWIRERTQSLALGIATHNVVNIGQQFI